MSKTTSETPRRLPCGGTPFTEVAKVLRVARELPHGPEAEDAVIHVINALADLFKRHKPPACQVGSHDGSCSSACLIEGSGFDSRRFLVDCGVLEEDTGKDS